MEPRRDGGLRIRIAVVGTGSIGLRHLQVLASLPGIEPVAVPVRRERVHELRDEGRTAEPTLDAARANGVAAVVIASDTGRHVADALAVADLPRLVEKPIAPSGAEARRLRGAAAVHVACVLRFDEGLLWMKERLPRLGRLTLADAECLSWLPSWRPHRDFRAGYAARPGEGGVLLDLIHEIDYCAWLFGAVTNVRAHLENRGVLGLPVEVEESARLELQHASGVCTSVRLSYAVRPTSRRLRVWGEHGELSWDGVARTVVWRDCEGQSLEGHQWSGPHAMYLAQGEAWVASLRGGSARQLATLEEGIHAVAVCDAARASSQLRAWVQP